MTVKYKKLFNTILFIDNILYKGFNIVTSFRKVKWNKDSIKLQEELNREHGTSYCY